MTCEGCGRDVELLGSYCGHCTTEVARAVNEAVDGIDVDVGRVHDVFGHTDGYLHVRLERQP